MTSVVSSNNILNTPIITCDIKNTTAYQKQLWETAKGDAHHDLSEVFKPSDYTKEASMREAFNEGLPNFKGNSNETIGVGDINSLDEEGCLSSIILTSNGVLFSNLKEVLINVANVTFTPEVDPTIIQIGLKESGTPLFQYNVVQFIIGCKTDPKLLETACKENFGETFFSNTKLSGNHKNASLIVDYSQHHFIEKLTTGAPLQDNIIYYLMTPEVVNDPAGKTNIHNKEIFHGRNEGVKLVSCIQTTSKPIAFTKYNPYEINPLNNFYSNYDFSLLPIKKIYTGGKSERLISTLNINYERGNKVPFTDTIEDSKGENSINSVIGFLKTIIKEIKFYFNKQKSTKDINEKDNLIFNFNSKVQQKRGGDWFQVLACHDAKNRVFTQILPENGRRTISGDDLGPVYFVTHDRIAVSYALLNGVNVIYLDYWGRVYVFKNNADAFFNGDTKPVEEILLNEMRKYWRGDLKEISSSKRNENSNDAAFMNDLIEKNDNGRTKYYMYEHAQFKRDIFKTFNIYKKKRDILIKKFRDELKETLNSQKIQEIEEKIMVEKNENNTIDTTTSHLKNLFSSCVKFAFVLNNFTRIDIDTDKLNEEYNELLRADPPIVVTSDDNVVSNENNKKKIRDLNRKLNILKGIFDKFGAISSSNNSNQIFLNWIEKNIVKLDVFKAANKIDLKEEVQNRYVSLDFKNKIGENNVSITDRYIYLPYIQVVLEKRGLDLITSFLDKLEDLIIKKFIPKQIPQRSTRTKENPIPVGFRFLNNILNLLSQAKLLLQAKESGDANIIDNVNEKLQTVEGLTSDFTDNIIVDEDLREIQNIENGNKYSNSTEFIYDDRVETLANGSVKVNDDDDDDDDDGDDGDDNGDDNDDDDDDDDSDSDSDSDNSDDDEQSGGGWSKLKLNSYGINVICDVSIKQITWQLLTCNLLAGTNLESLYNKKHYKRYKIDIAPSTEEQEEFNKQQFMENIRPVLINKPELAEVVEEKISLIGNISNFLTGLFKSLIKKGGADPEPDETNNEPQENLLHNFSIGYHPLLPIYMLLSPFYYTLGPKAQGDPFFYTYFTYLNVLTKMVDVLENNYLNNSSDNNKILSAYFIGFALRSFLFTSNTSEVQIKTVLNVVNMPEDGFSTFTLKNDSFSNLIMGTVHSTLDEDIAAFILLDSDLFNHFINNEVNIKGILDEGTPTENLPTYIILKEQIFTLLQRISSKINMDRGTPEINIVDEVQTSSNESILPSETEENPEINPEENINNITAKGIPGLSTQERLQRIEEQQKNSLITSKPTLEPTFSPFNLSKQKSSLDVSTFSDGDPQNMVTSTLSTKISRGGKTKKNRKMYKKNLKTNKNKNTQRFKK